MKVLLRFRLILLLLLIAHCQGKHVDKKTSFSRPKRASFFTDLSDPLQNMRRSIQGLTSNVGRSMQSIMSAISTRMKHLQTGLYRRAPRLVGASSSSPSSISSPSSPSSSAYSATSHGQTPYSGPLAASSSGGLAYGVSYYPAYKAPAELQTSSAYTHNAAHTASSSSSYPPFSSSSTSLSSSGASDAHQQHTPDEDCNCSANGPFLPVGNANSPHQTVGNTNGPYQPVENTIQIFNTVKLLPHKPKETNTIIDYVPTSVSNTKTVDVKYSHPVTAVPTTFPVPNPTPAPIPISNSESTIAVVDHHLTDEEICAHLITLKEDLKQAPVSHPGGSNNIDVHKLETIGVHSAVQLSSAVVPDQQHPEKYVSVECDNVKKVVRQTLYYKDTKPLIQKLKGHNKVRETNFHTSHTFI